MQDKLGKQNFHEDVKKDFEPDTKSLEKTSQDIPKTIMETSIKNNEAIEVLDDKRLEIMNDRRIIASYSMSLLSEIINPENNSPFKLVKDSNSNIVNDLLIQNTTLVTLYDIMLTFRGTGKVLGLKGDLLKLITNKNYNVDQASLSDKNVTYDFAKEMYFDVKAQNKKSTRNQTYIKMFKLPSVMVSASGVPKTRFFSSDSIELCDRLKLLLQEKQAGKHSDTTNKKIVAIVDIFLEYKCQSTKQQKPILVKCSLLHTKKRFHARISIITLIKIDIYTQV